MGKPLAIDLFSGLGGWTDGLLAEGYDVIGFDIERHVYGEHKYPAQLVIQDVLTLHGKQFRNADLIVASPPCQEYSYMVMPWTRAKQIAAEYRSGERDVKQLTALFDACFRIQREACEAAGRHIPLIVENVRGAQPWVGRSRWNYGSFHLWGDVPALMPMTSKRSAMKAGIVGGEATNFHREACNVGRKVGGFRFDGSGGSFQSASVSHIKAEGTGQNVPGVGWTGFGPGSAWRNHHGADDGIKVGGFTWSDHGKPGYKAQAFNHTVEAGVMRQGSSKSSARKAASAMIAKIPLPLSRHIARTFKPMAAHDG
jgi:hypothetical protein